MSGIVGHNERLQPFTKFRMTRGHLDSLPKALDVSVHSFKGLFTEIPQAKTRLLSSWIQLMGSWCRHRLHNLHLVALLQFSLCDLNTISGFSSLLCDGHRTGWLHSGRQQNHPRLLWNCSLWVFIYQSGWVCNRWLYFHIWLIHSDIHNRYLRPGSCWGLWFDSYRYLCGLHRSSDWGN